VQVDAEKRAFVDVRAEVTPDLVAIVGSAGIVVSSSSRDRSILVWLPLAKLNDLATLPNVRAIIPVAQAITQANPTSGQEFTLRVGGAVTVVEAQLTVSFESVTDSRCPASVTCEWAGDAVLRVGLVAADGTRATVELHTSSAGRQEATFHGHRVRLVQLTPLQPESTGLPQERYAATFVVATK
jgi:hypothetical protein